MSYSVDANVYVVITTGKVDINETEMYTYPLPHLPRFNLLQCLIQIVCVETSVCDAIQWQHHGGISNCRNWQLCLYFNCFLFIFSRGTHHWVPRTQRLFGGQIVGQALVAAAKSVSDNLYAHSLHCYFVRAGKMKHLSTEWTELWTVFTVNQRPRLFHHNHITVKWIMQETVHINSHVLCSVLFSRGP